MSGVQANRYIRQVGKQLIGRRVAEGSVFPGPFSFFFFFLRMAWDMKYEYYLKIKGESR